MVIAELENHEIADLLARLNHVEWVDSLDDVSLSDWQEFYQNCIGQNHGNMPITMVLQDQSEIIGAVSIDVIDDIKEFPELTPWVCCLIINPERRKSGHAKSLMQNVVRRISDLGFQEAFLWTYDQEEMYKKFGWETHKTLNFKGRRAVIMRISIPIETS